MVLGRHETVNNPLSVELYKQLGLHRKLTKNSSAVIANGHFIAEQILRYLSQVYCTGCTKMSTKRVFSCQQKTKLFIFTRYQSSKIDIILRQNLNLVRVLLYLCACKFSG